MIVRQSYGRYCPTGFLLPTGANPVGGQEGGFLLPTGANPVGGQKALLPAHSLMPGSIWRVTGIRGPDDRRQNKGGEVALRSTLGVGALLWPMVPSYSIID
eukprot:COSAG02_NODE_280_length_25797_cov_66.644447_20_plen_101_part_00